MNFKIGQTVWYCRPSPGELNNIYIDFVPPRGFGWKGKIVDQKGTNDYGVKWDLYCYKDPGYGFGMHNLLLDELELFPLVEIIT